MSGNLALPCRLLHACRQATPPFTRSTPSLRLLSSSPRVRSKAPEALASPHSSFTDPDDPPLKSDSIPSEKGESAGRAFIPSRLSYELEKLKVRPPKYPPAAHPAVDSSTKLVPSSAFETPGLEAAPNFALSHLGPLPPRSVASSVSAPASVVEPSSEAVNKPLGRRRALAEIEWARLKAEKSKRVQQREAEAAARALRPLSSTRVLVRRSLVAAGRTPGLTRALWPGLQIRHFPADMWEAEIEEFVADNLGTSSLPIVKIVRGPRQQRLTKMGVHKGEATINFATGGDHRPAEELAERAIKELHGFKLGPVSLAPHRSGESSPFADIRCPPPACRDDRLLLRCAPLPLPVAVDGADPQPFCLCQRDHKTQAEITRAAVRLNLRKRKRKGAPSDSSSTESVRIRVSRRDHQSGQPSTDADRLTPVLRNPVRFESSDDRARRQAPARPSACSEPSIR